jgi:circadian clock protein KaiC
MELQPFVDAELLMFYYSRPSLQNLELHFMTIKEKIETFKPTILILDPVTNLMTEGLNSDIRSLLIRFIEFLKSKQITIMFTAAITLGSILRNPNDEGISSMVDTWVMLEDKEMQGKRRRFLYVMKSRGMANSNEIREFLITSSGINLIPVKLKVFRNDERYTDDRSDDSNHNGKNKMAGYLNLEDNEG